jgi:hypothetical protein
MSRRIIFRLEGRGATTLKPFELCTQPECFLREKGVDSRSIAELVVRALAGVAMKSFIQPNERCVGCTQRILQGGTPLPTVAEFERSREIGRWAYRRSRRRMRRESRGS